MKNQFFYTEERKIPKQVEVEQGKEPEYEIITIMGSFNIDKVIRSLEVNKGQLMILLDDFHTTTDMKRVPVIDKKTGKPTSTFKVEKVEETVCSEIYLNEEDSARFKKLSEV